MLTGRPSANLAEGGKGKARDLAAKKGDKIPVKQTFAERARPLPKLIKGKARDLAAKEG